jgi:hypothetical protein
MFKLIYHTSTKTVDIYPVRSEPLLDQPAALGHEAERLFTQDGIAYISRTVSDIDLSKAN